jgi:PAS domain S-box-containing protein
MVASSMPFARRLSSRSLLVAIVIGGGSLTSGLYAIQRQHETALAAKSFQAEAESVVAALQESLRRSATLPKTAATVIHSLPRLDAATWRRFVEDLRPFDSVSGLVGYGVAERVSEASLDGFTERMVREGQGAVRVFPRNGPGPYWPVTYAEPEIVSKFARGFNLKSDPTRRLAMDYAADNADVGMTGLIAVGFINETMKPPGFLMFSPLYFGDRLPVTPEERHGALKGFTLAVFRLDHLMDAVAGAGKDHRVLSLFDMDSATPQLAYRSSRAEVVSDAAFHEQVGFVFGGHAWRIDVAATPEYVGRIDRQRSTGIFLAGWLVTLAGAGLIYTLASGRQRAEALARAMTQELRQSEERFRSLTSLSSDWYWEQDDQFRFSAMSNDFTRWHLGSSSVLGKCRWDLPIDLTPARWAAHRAVLEAHQPFQDFEYRIRTTDGVWHWFGVNGEPLFADDGRFLGYRGTGQDISQRKRAEHELALMSFALNDVHEAAYLHRIDTREILYVNEEACRALGYSREELLTKSISDFDPQITPEDLAEMERTLPELGHVTFETKHKSRDGRIFPVEIGLSFIEFDGERYALALARDISERQRQGDELRRHRDQLKEMVAEQTAGLLNAKIEAERASQAKSDFLANMSHELRTPMHAILSFAQFGCDRVAAAPREKLVEYFERIQASGGRLLGLIDNLLDLSKLEAGQMILTRQATDLSRLCDEVIRDLEPLMEARHLRHSLSVEQSLGEAKVDPVRLGQVLRNLLGNAIRFSPDGAEISVAVSATTMPGRRAGDTSRLPAVRLVVADQGIGIPEGELDSIFDRFIQSSKTRSGAGGTGLGLTICREIVHAHNGTISAHNRPGGGAEIEIVLPIS